MVYEVDVIFTDRTRLADGKYRTFRVRPSVMTDLGGSDAELLASQFVHALRADFDIMVLGACVVL